jgi:hypothetical protein
MIDFDELNLKYMGMEVPGHTRDTITNYLLRGWAPGGFVESMIARDYERALYCADTGNRQMFWAIAMWINERIPAESRGSYKAIEMWRDDLDSRRSAYVKEVEQKAVWKKLTEVA